LVELDSKVKKQLLIKALGEDADIKALKTKDIKNIITPFIEKEEDEIILNCRIVPTEIIEAEGDVLSGEDFEYNVVKYIDQFNSRIKPLLVCFSPEIRQDIIITNPDDRKYFTAEQAELTSGHPNKESDQDTYEQLMTPERKEIEFWLSIGEKPPFIDECGLNWENIVDEYNRIKELEQDGVFREENEKYLNALQALTPQDVAAFEDEGVIPSSLTSIVTLGSDMIFRFIALPDMTPSTGGYIFDDITYQKEDGDLAELMCDERGE
jgi:hypothetical protein